MRDELVSLCECWDIVEAHSLRASLSARGIPVLIQGEHHRAALGMFGAAVRMRAMVPRSQLALARQLAADLRPELGFEEADEGPLGNSSPARRLPLGERADDDDDAPEDDESEHEDANDESEPEPVDADDEAMPPPKKSLAAAMLLACMGLAVGTLHLYAGERQTGLSLLLLAALGVTLAIIGYPGGAALLMLVWAVDIARGLLLLARHNAAIDRAALDRPPPAAPALVQPG